VSLPSALVPEVTGAASLRVARHLRQVILDGTIAPGEWIRQEEVAERLGASRLPVREALRILEAEGLTEHVANRGARVPRLNMHEVDVLYRMRERLEPLALAESLDHLTGADLDRLESLQERIEADTGLADFLALDREFHLLTYTGCPIDQLTATVTRLWNSTQHYRRAFVAITGRERRWVVNAEHRLLLDAIRRRDLEDSERYLGGHIRRTRIELGRHPEVFAEAAP
jgi:DNA-binding GntR family transcriptional regulator